MQPKEEEDPLGGLTWAGGGPTWKEKYIKGELERAARMTGPKSRMGCNTILSNFSNKDLSSNVKDSNVFKPNLNCTQNRIKSNHFLGTFQI
jgi:hypothetical protein